MKREKLGLAGSKTVKEAGLKLKCAHCDYLVPDHTIISATYGKGKVAHARTPGCPLAGDKQCQWSVAGENWMRL